MFVMFLNENAQPDFFSFKMPIPVLTTKLLIIGRNFYENASYCSDLFYVKIIVQCPFLLRKMFITGLIFFLYENAHSCPDFFGHVNTGLSVW